MNLLKDIYYNIEYSDLYIKKGYELFNFEYRESNKIFKNIAIKKAINKIGNISVSGYFDLETPYGYGGFYSNTSDSKFIERAFLNYKKKCKEENIIAEFCTFHPFNNFPVLNKDCFEICFKDRDLIIVDLKKSDEERWLDFASKTRTIIRKCNRELKVSESDDIDTFISIYNETMKKNKAREFYYFDRKYFEKLLCIDGVKLIKVCLGEIVIAMSFFMLGESIGHYHLSANRSDYLKYNANYLILEEGFKLAKKKGCDYFLLGGGRTSNVDDTLFKFKRKFSKLTKDYYLAGNVYNQEIFSRYIKLWEDQNSGEIKQYFLRYRL